MRIIAGKLRGRTYKARKDTSVRPISGRIKQSLFDIIAGLVPGCRFLDIYAGTGAVGIEALSRGAEFVFFVDKNRRNVEDLTAILQKMGLAARAKAQPGDALEDMSWIPFRSGVSQFDLIFLGPPYKDQEKRPLHLSTPTLARVAEAKILAPKGWVILQHQVKEDVSTPEGLEQFRRQKYGDTYLDFFRTSPER